MTKFRMDVVPGEHGLHKTIWTRVEPDDEPELQDQKEDIVIKFNNTLNKYIQFNDFILGDI